MFALLAIRHVDEPLGHELKAEWLMSSRIQPIGKINLKRFFN